MNDFAAGCWKRGPYVVIADGEHVRTSCILAEGHRGACEFMRDDEIVIGLGEAADVNELQGASDGR